ncbi:cupin domain-containing protein [Deinococcus fonticola]|uniref:cupin domain-containing protein n=1 Tax=Deinococcus fonticola TaxID=2528713 RepID=UPI00197ADBDE|nr:cupin domain-containing protein [Deinococcus fonticola]
MFRRGSLRVELYRPRGHDRQTPHQQDELYVVVGGSGTFFCDGERQSFQAGDLLFAAAGAGHRFETFSDDLEVWVIFFGPPGGERPTTRTLFGQDVTE